ncbi:WD40 repeat domain-containing protein [Amycolatopsis sp. cg9]|uniref:WD40 repeat domain-containing protein n=1 Tax=Amycolatopsis sp. cg9 TaxID=3238801 RepID=UPI00352408E0
MADGDETDNSVTNVNDSVIIQAGNIRGDITVNSGSAPSAAGRARLVRVFRHPGKRGLILTHKVRVAIEKSGILATLSTDRRYTLWEMDTGLRLRSIWSCVDSTRPYGDIQGMALSRDGALFACQGIYRGSIAVLDTCTGAVVHRLGVVSKSGDDFLARVTLNSPFMNERVAYISPGAVFGATVESGKWRTWRLVDGAEMWSERREDVIQVVFSPDDSMEVVVYRGRDLDSSVAGIANIAVYDSVTGERRYDIDISRDRTVSVAFNPDGRRLVVSCASGMAVYDSFSGSLIFRLEAEVCDPSDTSTVRFPCNDLVTVQSGWRVGLWDLKKSQFNSRFVSLVTLHAVSRDGEWIAYLQTGEVCVRTISDGQLIVRIPGIAAQSLFFTADNHLGVCGSPNEVQLWEIKNVRGGVRPK